MDLAVGLVQTYLRINGYLTVTEFPVVESTGGGALQTATDLDLLACRFPEAASVIVGSEGSGAGSALPDPALCIPEETVDMIVGEVKEAAAEFNPGGLRPDVLLAALARFGCCPPGKAGRRVVGTLLRDGRAETHRGHVIRLVAFGTRAGRVGPYQQIGLDHVMRELERYVCEHWPVLRHTHSRDLGLATIMLREKARRAPGGRIDARRAYRSVPDEAE